MAIFKIVYPSNSWWHLNQLFSKTNFSYINGYCQIGWWLDSWLSLTNSVRFGDIITGGIIGGRGGVQDWIVIDLGANYNVCNADFGGLGDFDRYCGDNCGGTDVANVAAICGWRNNA